MTTEEQLAEMAAGTVDVGLSRDLEARDDLEITLLRREPLVAVVPAEHPLGHRRTVELSEIADSPLVALPRERVPRSWDRLVALAHASGVTLRFEQEANQYATVLALVAAEVGVAVVPASVRALRSDGVHYLRLRDHGAWSEITLAQRADSTNMAAQELHRMLSAQPDSRMKSKNTQPDGRD